MSKNYLWSIDNNDCVSVLSSWSNIWNPVKCSTGEIRYFRSISASSWCAWAIDKDNELCMYIPKSDIVIRSSEVVIESQRKSSGKFSSQYLQSVDPFEYTAPNYYGKLIRADLHTFELPSDRWRWEDEWTIQQKFDGQKTHEGWVYASNFMRKFQVERQFLSSNVRRRYWQRYRYFHTFDQWLTIDQDDQPFEISCSQNCCSDTTVGIDKCESYQLGKVADVGCGGEMLPHQKDGFLAIWIVNTNGQILFRLNVHRQNPEGSYWCHVKLPRHARAFSVSVGPLGSLLVCCSQGEMFFRDNVTWKNPIGTSWKSVIKPCNLLENECIVQSAIGVYSLWVRSNQGRVWSRTNVNLHEGKTKLALGDKWVMVATGISYITASASGQLLALSENNLEGGGQILYKSMKSILSPGKCYWTNRLSWEWTAGDNVLSTNIVCLSSSGLFLEDDIIPSSWIPSPRISHKTFQNRPVCFCDWRSIIYQELKTRDMREYKDPRFSHYTSPFEQTFWSKGADCQILCFATSFNRPLWLNASLVLHHKIRNDITCSSLHVQLKHAHIFDIESIPLFVDSNEILCVSKYCDDVGVMNGLDHRSSIILVLNNSASVHTTNVNVPHLLLKFPSEAVVEDWIMAFNFVAFSENPSSNRSSTGTGWILNKFHEPFSCPINRSIVSHSSYTWHQDGGHFSLIRSGAMGSICWAIGFNGLAWAHTPGWGGSYLGPLCSSREHLYSVHDSRSITIIEIQKAFISHTGMTRIFEPYLWTDKWGNIILDKDVMQPPCKRWQWEDDWTIDMNKNDKSQSEGWLYAWGINQKFDEEVSWNKNIRRRTWNRTYRCTSMGPWKEIRNNTLKLIDLAIYPAIDCEDEKNHLVVGVTRKNNLFLRKAVSIMNPEGSSWSPIKTELKITSITINVNRTVWVVCISGFIWRLKLPIAKDVTKIQERDWDKIELANADVRFREVSSSDNLSLWAVDCENQLWVRKFQENIYTASLGSEWINVCGGVAHISCGSQRLVWAVFTNGDLAERVGITFACPQGIRWEIKLTNIISGVSLNGA